MCQRCFFDRARELDRLFKLAVCNLHLLVGKTLPVKRIAPATSNPQEWAVQLQLQIVGANAREIYLDHPPVFTSIDVGGRVP